MLYYQFFALLRLTVEYSAAQSQTISKRRKFVADGVFYAELNEFFTRELAEEGYSGVEVRVTPTVTDISTSFSGPGFPAM
jgi:ribosomal protein S3